jgi:uncharacterized membrane protein HdeD (DUF308 family)
MPTNHATEAEDLFKGLEQAARMHWPTLLIEGVALILFGILALAIPALITLGISTALGWLFVSVGLGALAFYARSRTARAFRSLLVSSILSVIAGTALLTRPLSSAISVTVILIVLFAISGVAKFCYPLERSEYLSNYGGWIRTSGVIDVILAGLMFVGLPEIALWAPGLLLGANMVLGGVALIVVAVLERRRSSQNQMKRSATA